MDPVTAIGLASAIIAFVDAGSKIVKRINELSAAGDIPKVFQDIKTRLPLIISIINRTQDGVDDLSSEAKEAFHLIIDSCYSQVDQLDKYLQKYTLNQRHSTWKKTAIALGSMVEEAKVQRIALALRDNVQLLTSFNTTPTEKKAAPKGPVKPSTPPPPYAQSRPLFLLPFSRDTHFVGREGYLKQVSEALSSQMRVALAGIGGVGKSQVAIEYSYRFRESNLDAHVFWVYGGNIARFYQGYKNIAQELDIPSWDDPEVSILELVSEWLAKTDKAFLLVIDNADNIAHYWPGKYRSDGKLDDPTKNLSTYLPASGNGKLLITTRDTRIAKRLAKEGISISLQAMSSEEARSLFRHKADIHGIDHNETEVDTLLKELDYLPLAITQAASFIDENNISIGDYLEALKGDDAEEFLHEELDDARRDEESVNSVFRTWKLSFDQISQQKPRAAELLSLIVMLDRQSIHRCLLKEPEVVTSLATLLSFGLISNRTDKNSYQIHRLVQRFVQTYLKRSNTLQTYQDAALAAVSREYPTEIGVAEWSICDNLAPHVQIVTKYTTFTDAAKLDLANLLCWAADFDVERGLYTQALERAGTSKSIFEKLVSPTDQRLASSLWMYGRLLYYEAKSDADMALATSHLQQSLRTSTFPSITYGESAFELAHLYYDQGNIGSSLEMGKASFECYKEMLGPDNVRTLDNMHDYALQLALDHQESAAIDIWHEILRLCNSSNAAADTKTVFQYRSMAGIAEFEGDSQVAEIFYEKLIVLCEELYSPEHVHVFEYRLSHCEQVMRQGCYEQAMTFAAGILGSNKHKGEWRIEASCLEIMAETRRMQGLWAEEIGWREKVRDLYIRMLGREHRDAVDAIESEAKSLAKLGRVEESGRLWMEATRWWNERGVKEPPCKIGEDRRFGRIIHPRTWSS